MDNPTLPGFNIPAVDGLRGNPYLTKQLIAYLGNKRALLGFLADIFSELNGRHRIRIGFAVGPVNGIQGSGQRLGILHHDHQYLPSHCRETGSVRVLSG